MPSPFGDLGYHEYREQWMTDSWTWFESQRSFTDLALFKEEAQSRIQVRRNDVLAWNNNEQLSRHAQLYALLADLTDEVAAREFPTNTPYKITL